MSVNTPATVKMVENIIDGTTAPVRANSAQTASRANVATSVTSEINGHDLTEIFESDGTTVKNATNATNATNANKVNNKLKINVNGSTTEYDGSSEESITISTGGTSDPDAVRFTPQSLTTEQKQQARTNIGAQEAGNYATIAQLNDVGMCPDTTNKIEQTLTTSSGTDTIAPATNGWLCLKVTMNPQNSITISQGELKLLLVANSENQASAIMPIQAGKPVTIFKQTAIDSVEWCFIIPKKTL